MNTQQVTITHIQQPMPYDLLDMDEPQDIVEFNMSEQDIEDYEWEEFESTDILMELNESAFDASDY